MITVALETRPKLLWLLGPHSWTHESERSLLLPVEHSLLRFSHAHKPNDCDLCHVVSRPPQNASTCHHFPTHPRNSRPIRFTHKRVH
ncbi:unnamed protein product [Protopolystoma xenopodis]|uniref:Uncharacterized protein n=1 Tax=Protopolystoma xenopodis TaxID=117903 RepID=A0A448X3D5_9PLAT|nr:unnamed protein product [Protopolystoma xenopodis]